MSICRGNCKTPPDHELTRLGAVMIFPSIGLITWLVLYLEKCL